MRVGAEGWLVDLPPGVEAAGQLHGSAGERASESSAASLL